MNNRPIGLLDSGIGGLTVQKKLMEVLPIENTVFIADQKNLPYGDKTPAEILKLTRKMVDFLIEQDVKLIIFACNTATAWALEELRPEIDVPLIGVIQSGSELAVKTSKNKKIGVIATTATINSHAYQREIKNRGPEDQVFEHATPKLVEYIESGAFKANDQNLIRDSLGDLVDAPIDTLILGCTHYPIIKDQIKNQLPNVTLVDPADQVASYTKKVLEQRHELSEEYASNHQYFTTGDVEHFNIQANQVLGLNDISAIKANLDD